MKLSENMNNNLPKEIFKFLNEKGAGLGNVSIILISQVLGLYIPKVEALEKQNKNTTENLVRAKQILKELREQLGYEQKQNEQLQQEKKELKEYLDNIITFHIDCDSCNSKDSPECKSCWVTGGKQLLSKTKE
jgi:hypothetical protein